MRKQDIIIACIIASIALFLFIFIVFVSRPNNISGNRNKRNDSGIIFIPTPGGGMMPVPF